MKEMPDQEEIENCVLKNDNGDENTHILNIEKNKKNNGDGGGESSSKDNQIYQRGGVHLVQLARGEEGETLTIYSMDERKLCSKSMPYLTTTWVMSSFGWVLMKDLTGELTLLNPVSSEVINIPSPPHAPQLQCEVEIERYLKYYLHYVYRLTAAPTERGCVLVAVEANEPYVNFYDFQEKKWFQRKYKELRETTVPRVVTCNKSIYVIRTRSRSVKLDFNNNNYELTTEDLYIKHPDDLLFPIRDDYVIESSGELFFIKAVEVMNSYLIKGFSVYKMKNSSEEMKWVPVGSIGNRAFCLDFALGRGLSFDNAREAGLKEDCIYYFNEGHLYRYNLLNRSITVLESFRDLYRSFYLPQWAHFSPPQRKNGNDCNKDLENNEDLQRYNGIMTNDTRKPLAIENNASQEEEPWLKLLPELVPEILQHLSYMDSRCLIHAIPRWIPAIRGTATWQLDSPCLLSFSNDLKKFRLLDPLRNMCHLIDSSIIIPNNEIKILHCNYGWLLLMASEGSLIFFYNPLTKYSIYLPPFIFNRSHNFSFSCPPTCPNCVVAAYKVNTYYRSIIVCCKGHRDWMTLNDEHFKSDEMDSVDKYTTPVFLTEKIYFSGEDGRIRIFDLANGSWHVHGFKLEMPHHHRHYLVETDGEIFLVRGTLNGDSICMYKLNLSSYTWEETQSSGGRCFFLSPRTSISVSTSEFLKDNEEKLYFPMLHSRKFVYYSCEKREMHPRENFEGVEELLFGSCWIEPHWVQLTAEELEWS